MNLDLDRCRSLGPMILWKDSEKHRLYRSLEVFGSGDKIAIVPVEQGLVA